jgi:uncharacterized protein (TIGR04255 family)
MTETQDQVPKFENPPIVEKLMGVQFRSLETWSVPHFGLFWQTIKSEFPEFAVQPPLVQPGFYSEEFAELPIRCWFFNEAEKKLIQVQQDRFLFNWQKPNEYAEYPHHEAIRPEFESAWGNFVSFLSKNQIESPIVEQCEITYVNHLEKGREWKDWEDLPHILRPWSGETSSPLLSRPALVTLQAHYPESRVKGTIIISVAPAIRDEDSKELLQLRITVVGKPNSQSIEDMLAWFDAGRDVAVRSFSGLTTQEMHKIWGRRD